MLTLRTFRLPRFGLPLLARELTEMANRRRTYVLRVVYGLLLFFLAFLRFHDILRQSSSRFGSLGHGSQMFETLVTLQFGGIYLFMPIIGCSAITQEKEQNTLPLLLLTRLGPTTILFEKLLSRLMPMFVFQLLAMPLLAFAYSLGGVDEDRLWWTIFVLALTAVQVASITLMCSAYCRSTVTAFLSSIGFSWVSCFFCSCCGATYLQPIGRGYLSIATDGQLIFQSIVLLGSTVFFLLLARSYLLMRHVASSGRELQPSLQRYERVEFRPYPLQIKPGEGQAAEQKMVYVWPGLSLPNYAPVAWRELARRSNRTLGAVIVLIELGVGLLVLPAAVAIIVGEPMNFVYQFVEVLLWIVAVVLIVVHTTGTIPRERTRQTLDVLLTTPISGREIVNQKLQPAWRLVLMLWIPFGTVLLLRSLYFYVLDFDGGEGMGLLSAGLALAVYLPLLVWISAWIGLRVRSQGRAIMLTLGLVTVWVLLPVFLPLPESMPDRYRIELLSWFTLSPLAMFLTHSDNTIITAVLLTLFLALLHGLLLVAIRYHVLNRADAWLGRLGDRDGIALTVGAGVPVPPAEGSSS